MPINPLELQTNFSQVNQVGKMQSSIKDFEQLKEAQINTLIQKNSEAETEDIPTTKDVSEGLGKIKDQEKRKNFKGKEKKESENDSEDIDDESNEKNNLKNPQIGQHIDIIG